MPDSLQPHGLQPCKDDEEAEDRQCVSQQEVETVAQKNERQQRSQAVIQSDIIDITRRQVPLVELSTRPVPARKGFEHQLNRETFCVLLQMVQVLFAVLNHALRSRDGLDCSDGTILQNCKAHNAGVAALVRGCD